MNFRFFKMIFLTLALLATFSACSPASVPAAETTPTPLPPPVLEITPAPDTTGTLNQFFQAWKSENYAGMYGLLTSASQQRVSQEDFVQRYRDAMMVMSLREMDYQLLASTLSPSTAQASARVQFDTHIVGTLERDLQIYLRLENGGWRVDWNDSMILPELANGATLRMDYQIPARGTIFDRNGTPLVTQAEAYAIGIIPGQIVSEPFLLSEIFRLTGLRPETVQSYYANAGSDWYVAVGQAPAADINRTYTTLSNLGGLVLSPYTARYYFNGGIAPQTVGYVISLPREELDDYRQRGYRGDEKVGAAGIERWAEEILSGTHGGSLYVANADGLIGARLAQTAPQPANDITLTFERDFQLQVEAAMSGFRGAIVVLERDTGRVLAMASTPKYDPNFFEPTNRNSGALRDLLNDTRQPLVNRASQGQYPLGSVFKIITYAAALESGAYTAESEYDCQYFFRELPDRTLNDWTYERFVRDGTTQPSGVLTLSQGLMRSCNPWFWHIGLGLFNSGRTTAISEMSRAFGLGQATGIGQIPEATGNIPDPQNVIDAVNLSIGQGTMQVTPLQVATFIAAVGNGGTLYRPQVVEQITDANGNVTQAFKPESRGVLPLSPENLASLQESLISVVRNPRGTAVHRFNGLNIRMAGKTGTAESGSGLPHSWFAGYTYEGREDKPDIAIAVLVENRGEGSDYAAPIFRRVVELYYTGRPQRLYWWESAIGITRTPTPLGFELTLTAQPEEE
jgi:penicillin-binding protein 2